MAVTWDKFHPQLLPEVPGCPTASINLALAAAAAEFCERSHIWRELLDTDTTFAGEAEYQLFGSAVIASVPSLALDGRDLRQLHFEDIPASKWVDTGTPTAFIMAGDHSVRFYPIPDAKYEFTAQVNLKPSKTATGVEDFIFETFEDVLVHGAAYRLCRIPDKEWTNLPLAATHKQLFERGVVRARVRDYREMPLRVRPQPF